MNFTAIKALLGMLPSWCWALLLGLALYLAGDIHGAARVQKKVEIADAARKAASDAAVDLRREENRAKDAKQKLDSANIQRNHDDEISTVRTAVARSERLRIGTAICPVAGSAEANGASSSDGANSSGRVLSPEMDGAVKSLILEIEQVASIGRAAQEFIERNGRAPDKDFND